MLDPSTLTPGYLQHRAVSLLLFASSSITAPTRVLAFNFNFTSGLPSTDFRE